MLLIGKSKLELFLFCLISLIAYSVGLSTNIDDLHNQLNDNQKQKRASGFVPMRGRKNDEEFSNSNIDRTNAGNDKEINQSENSDNLDLVKQFNNFLKSNNGNLEDQLSLLDQTMGNDEQKQTQTNNGLFNLLNRNTGLGGNGGNGFENFRKYHPMINQRLYNQQVTPFLGLMTRYGSPKRAGFVPMRGRKSDPSVLLTNDDDDYTPYSSYFKRAGFLPMRGKKSSMELDDLENQYNQYNQIKRAFHALRG